MPSDFFLESYKSAFVCTLSLRGLVVVREDALQFISDHADILLVLLLLERLPLRTRHGRTRGARRGH
ncbi:hypothetical protein PENTCL1PPCAC_19976, partial [Pristionchus entomophagus]